MKTKLNTNLYKQEELMIMMIGIFGFVDHLFQYVVCQNQNDDDTNSTKDIHHKCFF